MTDIDKSPDPEKENEVVSINNSLGELGCTILGMAGTALFVRWFYEIKHDRQNGFLFIMSIFACIAFIGLGIKVFFDFRTFVIGITAVGKMGDANRSLLIILGLFLLILVVIVFGTILVLK